MSYNKTTWVDGETPLSAQNMNKIENQLEQNTNDIAGIISSGNNTNGEWVKYSDGTMICYMNKTYNVDITRQWGSVYETAGVPLGDFTQSFVEIPVVTASCTGASSVWIEAITPTKTSLGSSWFMRPVSTSNAQVVISYIAIGRWK